MAIKPFSFILGAVTGAAAQYFLDSRAGSERRGQAADQAKDTAMQASGQAKEAAMQAAEQAREKATEAASQAKEKASDAVDQAKEKAEDAASSEDGAAESELNDPTLAAKVESEIFRDENAPKGDVNVNVENGVVYLRGQLEDNTQIQALAQAAGEVEGVERVENLLHTPDTPAPTK